MEKTIASPIADECRTPPDSQDTQSGDVGRQPIGIARVGEDRHSHTDDEIQSLDYFAIEGEKARLNLELRARMAHQRADAEGEASA